MPEQPPPKLRPARPAHRVGGHDVAGPPYAELAVTSNFTFLTGGSHPEELVDRAAELGHRAIAITDTHSLAGVVRAHAAAKEASLPLVIGSRLFLSIGAEPEEEGRAIEVLVYLTDLAAYGRLCRLLTLGKRRATKGDCHLTLHDLLEHERGLLAVLIPPRAVDEQYLEIVRGLKGVFDDDRLSIAASVRYRQDDTERLKQVATLCEHTGVPMVAVHDVLYHDPGRRPLQDILTCIRHGCTIAEAGLRLEPHAERHLKTPEEMARLFSKYPHAIRRTVQIANRCAGFSLDQLKYQYPHEVVPADSSPMQHLSELTWSGAAWRYPRGVPVKVRRQIEHELSLVDALGYPHYFLTVHDLVRFAHSRGILCQGRGAAANSAICYCLGITAVDPERIELLFERFVSRERAEPPDIDVDFEHERREEVIQHLYRKYGRERAALTAEVITHRARSAVREVGEALGLGPETVDRLAQSIDGMSDSPVEPERLRSLGLNPDDPLPRRLVQLSGELMGFPRHLSQHVGGFVLTDRPLSELVPIENAAMEGRTVIEWDKDDIERLGMMKVDVLGLGMLSCLRKGFELVRRHHGRELTLANVPHQEPTDDPAVYQMISEADTVGVFQIESRAQMSMLPRLRPRRFYDLVIEVAIVRPGPIQGQMVHPYLRRRAGEEAVDCPDGVTEAILGRTLGVPLFQEQAMSLAIRCAGFTAEEAERLRKSIQAWKSKPNEVDSFHRRFVEGMTRNGYRRDYAERCFSQFRGFSEYGFPESHAASFALLVYVSAWLKHHYPAAYTAALLNSQPMGFYAPAQLIRDAQNHGVPVRPVDVNYSGWDCTLEDGSEEEGDQPALRLGLRMVKGLQLEEAERLVETVRTRGPFRSLDALWRTSGVRTATLRTLAGADAFGSMGLDRQHALWQIYRLRDEDAPLFQIHEEPERSAPRAGSERMDVAQTEPHREHEAHIKQGTQPLRHAPSVEQADTLPRSQSSARSPRTTPRPASR